jgi:hypothetical protein
MESESYPPYEDNYINAERILAAFERIREKRGTQPVPPKLEDIIERNKRIKEQGSKRSNKIYHNYILSFI